MNLNTSVDVVVIGAGPAGLMAAGQAASQGASVLLLEKKDRPALKLRITGKGRCNVTNTADRTDFFTHFGREGRFLHHAFGVFFSQELLDFLNKLGVETESERGGRIFPKSNDANEVADALVQWTKSLHVKLLLKHRVIEIKRDASGITGVRVQTGDEVHTIQTRRVILATGGASYPGTGSTGDGFQFAKTLGHSLVAIRPALVPLETAGPIAKQLQGLSLKNAGVTVRISGKKEMEAFGEMLFTHFGVSGPIILTLSKGIVRALSEKKPVELGIDLKPALDEQKLDARLLREIQEHPKQQLKSMMKTLLPQKMIDVCLEQNGLDPQKMLHEFSKEERKRLRNWLKSFGLVVSGHRPIAEAIVTAGGVDLKEVDAKTMESKKCPGLYLAGEVLNLDGDTGGYNLQAAFSTGWLAGRSSFSRK